MNKNYQQAEDFFKQHKIKAAMPLFEKVIDKEPDNIEARYKFGICLYRLKELSNAEQVFRDITTINNSHYEAWYYLGLALENQNNKKNATVAYRISLAINPNFKAAKKKLEETNEIHPKSSSIGITEQVQSQSEEGPGQIVYSIKRRRMGSFTRHAILIILTFLVAFLLVVFFPDPKEEAIYIYSAIFCFAIIVDLFLRSITSKFIIYERRIDFIHGIVFKKHQSLWLFEIKNLSYHRNPWFLLTRNAAIDIESEKGDYVLSGLSPPKEGNRIGAVEFSQMLFDSLRNIVRSQRGEIKKVWI